MIRLSATVVAMCLLVAACTATTTDPEVDEVQGPGRLVVVDESGDVVVFDPDGENRTALTEDAGEDAIYSQPTWSPDGSSLAWGQLTSDGFALGFQVVEDESAAVIPTAHLPFYLYWSPDSENIGVLHTGSNGLDFEIVDVAEVSASIVDRGSPYYFSWSPDSDQVVTHVGPDRFETITPNGSRERLGTTAAGYLAPQWTPAGIFHIDADGLVVEAVDGDRRTVIDVGEFTVFVANPQGTKVAMQSAGTGDGVTLSLIEVAAVPSDVVAVVDVATGETEVVANEPAIGFFWSPDGESLLVMTPTGEGMKVQVWNDGSTVDYPEFRPSIFMARDLFPFFPQYAQSMSLWSPDSSAFTYAADDGIYVQELSGAERTRISGGSWVAWSN